ncbi:hypothetical protein CMO88_00370 [Candidatus Woesearchaeota archaeon]|nr:hypothetical protein [Candidatus Woesearchaeota archaeon]
MVSEDYIRMPVKARKKVDPSIVKYTERKVLSEFAEDYLDSMEFETEEEIGYLGNPVYASNTYGNQDYPDGSIKDVVVPVIGLHTRGEQDSSPYATLDRRLGEDTLENERPHFEYENTPIFDSLKVGDISQQNSSDPELNVAEASQKLTQLVRELGTAVVSRGNNGTFGDVINNMITSKSVAKMQDVMNNRMKGLDEEVEGLYDLKVLKDTYDA